MNNRLQSCSRASTWIDRRGTLLRRDHQIHKKFRLWNLVVRGAPNFLRSRKLNVISSPVDGFYYKLAKIKVDRLKARSRTAYCHQYSGLRWCSQFGVSFSPSLRVAQCACSANLVCYRESIPISRNIEPPSGDGRTASVDCYRSPSDNHAECVL